MAGLAAKRCAVRAFARHAVVELPLMGILVAGIASPVFKLERENFVGAAACSEFMAVATCNRHVRAGQRKARGSMLGDGKRSAMKIHNRVAAFAPVVVGRGRELIVMGVLVAIAAGLKLHFINSVLARGDVALRTFNLDVFSLQGITRSVVFLHSEKGGLPAIHVVAFRALALLCAALKLAFVGIRFVAVVAIRKCDLFLEVAIKVAGDARNMDVLSGERIFRFRVVEIKSGQHRLPTAGGVAGIAGFLEFSLVRITVAGGAGAKLHVAIPCGPSGRVWLVALFASHFRMQAGEGITRLGMVEVFGCFPTLDVVALGAFVAELTFVRIVVAGLANR